MRRKISLPDEELRKISDELLKNRYDEGQIKIIRRPKQLFKMFSMEDTEIQSICVVRPKERAAEQVLQMIWTNTLILFNSVKILEGFPIGNDEQLREVGKV
jgi:hypothetical protein